MSKTVQHTPGPWRVEPLQWDHGASIAIVGGTPDDSYIVATIAPENEEDEPTMDTAKRGPCDLQNASLMAAAPELLRAVELWMKFFDTMPKGQFGKIVCDIGLMNQAFLASASGLRTAGRT